MSVFEIHKGGGGDTDPEVLRAQNFAAKLMVATRGTRCLWLCTADTMLRADPIDVVMVADPDPEAGDPYYTVSCFLSTMGGHTDEYVIFSSAVAQAARIVYDKISDAMLDLDPS